MTSTLTPESRTELLDELATTRFDVIVIGGGIAGAGIAREAAARGLRVALCEADDFGVGTSSRSSKLIHGGLRYLAQGRFDFVRRTARERNAVHAMAPHLARPCWMVAPARHWMQARGIRCALAVYERLGRVDRRDAHLSWDRDELALREPSLRLDAYGRAIAFREYLTDDVRLVLSVLRAAAESGAVLSSRTPVRGLLREGLASAASWCIAPSRAERLKSVAVLSSTPPDRGSTVWRSSRLSLRSRMWWCPKGCTLLWTALVSRSSIRSCAWHPIVVGSLRSRVAMSSTSERQTRPTKVSAPCGPRSTGPTWTTCSMRLPDTSQRAR